MSHPEKEQVKIAVIGLGYVGLPVALAFAKYYPVTGYDTDPDRNRECEIDDLARQSILFTSDKKEIRDCNVYIVAVPTPVDKNKLPDLSPLIEACETVGSVLKKEDLVIFESTVYPGCTEEECLPVIENVSGMSLGNDFRIAYSPERINPGDKNRSLTDIRKVVSGSDEEALEKTAKLYGKIIKAGVFRARSIKVAEASKIVENTQRDVNIALMNELAIVFDKLGIDTHDVLDAAGTKWNFLQFYPGLVGGHCIDVDPYYLTYKSIQLGYAPDVILSGRRVNKAIPRFIAHKVIRNLVKTGKQLTDSRILIKGITFKENVSDYRNSKVFDLIGELEAFELKVEVLDPYVSKTDNGLRGINLVAAPSGRYDSIIIAVAHDAFRISDFQEWEGILSRDPIIFDVKKMYKELELPQGWHYFAL